VVNFVSLVEARGPSQIDRYQRQRRVNIGGNLVGIALSDALRTTKEIAAEIGLPPGYDIVFTGKGAHHGGDIAKFPQGFRPRAHFHVHDFGGAV
jgi:HAE1 family hydrophobic/amphiphilic exporter-1